ncbi:hypothetical protein [Bifidobacterium callitrichidarum]|uniref:Uncharacterized protein n=1 Tax=Bifidobacterium callitrichidarum TaxID=2052941 RepID=A0A2U2NCD8_9BIFI|nr:hypothetical protein [Bifidobacterium callitrichidarum]PWG66757.1 hypothetical protein DF196_02310 [Bifidobacterium callitrichidarum]
MINQAYKHYLLEAVKENVRSKHNREIITRFIEQLDSERGSSEPSVFAYGAASGAHVVTVRTARQVADQGSQFEGLADDQLDSIAEDWAWNLRSGLEDSPLDAKAFADATAYNGYGETEEF